MAPKKKVSAPLNVDPTLGTHTVVIGDKEYRMCFDFRSLAIAESALVATGHEVNILAALPRMNLSSVMILFAASIRRFHPEVGFEEAKGLLNIANIYRVQTAIIEAWTLAMPEPEGKEDKANPTEPGL